MLLPVQPLSLCQRTRVRLLRLQPLLYQTTQDFVGNKNYRRCRCHWFQSWQVHGRHLGRFLASIFFQIFLFFFSKKTGKSKKSRKHFQRFRSSQSCFRSSQSWFTVPRKRWFSLTADACRENTVISTVPRLPWLWVTAEACRANARDLLLLYRDCRGFRLPRKRAVQMPSFMITVPRLPWFSPAAEACQENAVISDHCTKTAAVWGYCGSVPCECRDREQPCHDLPYRGSVPRTSLENLDLLRPNYRRNKEEKKKNGDQVSGWTRRTCLQNFTVYLSKTAWTFRLLCGKHVYFA